MRAATWWTQCYCSRTLTCWSKIKSALAVRARDHDHVQDIFFTAQRFSGGHSHKDDKQGQRSSHPIRCPKLPVTEEARMKVMPTEFFYFLLERPILLRELNGARRAVLVSSGNSFNSAADHGQPRTRSCGICGSAQHRGIKGPGTPGGGVKLAVRSAGSEGIRGI
jgi:hypothetical protein